MRIVQMSVLPVIMTLAAGLPSVGSAMTVAINHAERLNVPGAAASVIVGNADIVSVTVVDSHTVYIMGRAAGTTNIVVLDKVGRTLISEDMTVAPAGSSVTVYRGAARSQVNCNVGCVEAGGK